MSAEKSQNKKVLKSYACVENIRHNGGFYEAGSEISGLTYSQAEVLLRLGAIKE